MRKRETLSKELEDISKEALKERFKNHLHRVIIVEKSERRRRVALNNNLSPSSITNWLEGDANPSYKNMIKLILYFELGGAKYVEVQKSLEEENREMKATLEKHGLLEEVGV